MKGKNNKQDKLDDVLERGKKFLDFINNNIYGESDKSKTEDNLYSNPFSTVKKAEDDLDTLDRIELLEYSQTSGMGNHFKEKNNVSESNDISSYIKEDFIINIKDFDNFILKIEDLEILEDKTLNALKDCMVYIECKVPLFRGEDKSLFYDTFKIFNKSPIDKNIFHFSHVSYHKLKLEEENFGVLTNSLVELYLHKLEPKSNQDVIIGRGLMEFNRVFLAKDFFFTVNLDIFNTSSALGALGKNIITKANDNKNKKSVTANKKKQGQGVKKNIKAPSHDNNDFVDFTYKSAELQISCQLFKSNLDKEKDLKENVRQLEKYRAEENELSNNENILQNNNQNNLQDLSHPQENMHNLNFEEIKIDYEGILVLYLNISHMKPTENLSNPKIDKDIYRKNYFLSHKIFPNADVSETEIQWNTIAPNFNYQMMMPFTLTARTIEMLDAGFFIIEVWHKGNYEDELLGTVKLELSPIIESLKISEDTLSISPISKNMLPLIIYDGFYPVYNFEEFSNVFYLNLVMGIGTTTQINNYIRKQPQQQQKVEKEKQNVISQEEKRSEYIVNLLSEKKNSSIAKMMETEENKVTSLNEKKLFDDDINDINRIFNNNMSIREKENSNVTGAGAGNNNNNNNTNFIQDDIDVEEILERNKKQLENVNSENRYKFPMSSLAETKKYEGNPFLINSREKENNNNSINNNKNQEKRMFNNSSLNNSMSNNMSNANIHNVVNEPKIANLQVSKQSNFYINEKSDLGKLTDNDFFKTGKMVKMDSIGMNTSIPDFNNLKINDKDSEEEAVKISKKEIELKSNKNKNNENIPTNPNNQNAPIKHIFEILIDKLINLQVLCKLNHKSFLKYKFLSDSDSEFIKSDTLVFTSYDKECSVIEVDMKTTHSILLFNSDKIKDFLNDFTVELAYSNSSSSEEIVFGKVSLPVEELLSLVNLNLNMIGNEFNTTLFIYGTDKIKRQDCIIGKMKMSIKYEKAVIEAITTTTGSSENILIERQTVFNRKIPKNASLIFRLNYFKYEEKFLDLFDVNTGVYYLEIDPFGEDKKKFKKIFSKQRTSKKYNSLNGIFEEEFTFNLVIESDILEYLKNKNALVKLVVYNKSPKMFLNSSRSGSDSDNENYNIDNNDNNDSESIKEVVGIAKIKLSEILSNTDFRDKNYNVISVPENSNLLGNINMEIKIDNNYNQNETHNKSKTKKVQLKLDNLKEIMKEKSLDGKYYFIVNLKNLICDDSFNKKLLSYSPNNNHFYLLYKFGKHTKKMTAIFDLNNRSEVVTPFFIFNLNHEDLLELPLQFSKNKPDDIIKQLIENVFEVKLYIKTEEENEHIGSFMIDLGRIFSSPCKINSNVFHSNDCLINYFDLGTKSQESLKLACSFSLIKSDLSKEEFRDFYTNTKAALANMSNYKMLREVVNKESNAKKVVKSLISEKNYEYADLYLFNLEDDRGVTLTQNVKKMLQVFGDKDFSSEMFNYTESINEIFSRKKLNLKRSVGNVSRYVMSKEKVQGLLNCADAGELVESYCNDKESNNLQNIKFGVYQIDSSEEGKVDLLEFLLEIYKYSSCSCDNFIPNNQDEKSNNYITKYPTQTSVVNVTIFSASNLTNDSKPLNQKPNSYFVFNWDEDAFTSDVIIKTAHPSWNQKLQLKIPMKREDVLNKFGKIIVVQFFSKNDVEDNNYLYSDDFIGEVRINLNEIVRFNFLNEKGEYEDFFNIYNENKIRGQLNAKIHVEEKLLRIIDAEVSSRVSRTNYNNINNINDLNDKINVNKNMNRNYTNTNSNTGFNRFKDADVEADTHNLDTESLWDRLHRNTATIMKLTQEIDLDQKYSGLSDFNKSNKFDYCDNNCSSNFNTMEREKRITEKTEQVLRKSNANENNSANENSLFNMDMDLNMDMNMIESALNEIDLKNNSHNDNEEDIFINKNTNNISIKSLDIDALNLPRKFPDFIHSDEDNDLDISKKENRTMMENNKNSTSVLSRMKIKKPPIPALNKLYQNADKQLLSKIQRVLKKKDSKRLNYASSDDSS